ncbi:MAG: NRAMP family divalent metal transporter [Phycisphaerales bacterium JB060]
MPTPARTRPRLLAALGPGILFAGAAIGVSHLVQSTRAGAVYGLSLVLLVVLAHAMKLPAMLFGPRYAAATGRSLLHAYRRQGPATLGAFAVIQVGTMFTIQAAVTAVTAALVGPLVLDPVLVDVGLLDDGQHLPLWVVAAGILLICIALLGVGGFKWLDRVVKLLMLVMAVGTVVAAGMQLPNLDLSSTPLWPSEWNIALLVFAVALVGWMPAPLDITVWHSLWSLARNKQRGHTASRRECELDFYVGFALCVVLAVAFVVLGAALLYGAGEEPASAAGAFANQLVGLYTESLGAWSRPLIATCAIAVMFSTTITVLDAIPRTMSALVGEALGRESKTRLGYWGWLLALASGAVVILAVFVGSLSDMVDLATTLSFLGTPLLAFFNHRAMTSKDIPAEHRPARWLVVLSWAGVAFWSLFAVVFVATWFVD